MNFPRRLTTVFLLPFALLVGCVPSPTPTRQEATITPPRLTPFVIQSPTMTPSVTPIITSTQKPLLATPTPFTYTIQEGDTLFGLAIRFDTTVDEIVAANPDKNTTILSIGEKLVIPTGEKGTSGQLPTPTPIPIKLHDPDCYLTAEGGLTCFIFATNQRKSPVENLSAVLNLHKANGEIAVSKVAFPPINVLNPKESIPLSADIPPPLPDTYQVFSSLMTSLSTDQERRSAEIRNLDTEFHSEGKYAVVSGEINLEEQGEPPPEQVWVVAVGLDEERQVVGLRKWVHPMDGTLKRTSFQFNLYSLGPPIEEIQIYTELR